MRDPFSRSFFSPQSSGDSWLFRVRENLRQLLLRGPLFSFSANGAPIHLLQWEKSARPGRAQRASFLTHAAILGTVIVLAVHPPGPKRQPFLPGEKKPPILSAPPGLLDLLRGHNPNGGRGSGTGHDLLPPTQGHLPPQRAKPRSRESWRCRFWSAPTGERRRFDSSKESVWDSTSARYNLFEAGSSFRRATLRAATCPLGSLWKPSFAFSRQSFNNGEAFFTVSYEFTPWEQEPTPQTSSQTHGDRRPSILRGQRRGRPAPSPLHRPA
jgi:hypothetical protein